MELIKNIVIIILLIGSGFFFIAGTLGLIRLNDVFSRLHATTKCDTLGAGLGLLAIMIYRGLSITSIKILLIIVFIWVTNPTSSHVISKAAYDKRILGK